MPARTNTNSADSTQLVPTTEPSDTTALYGNEEILAVGHIASIPLTDILTNAMHPRDDFMEDIDELIEAYQTDPDGVPPIVVSLYAERGVRERFIIVKGHRRYSAAVAAGLERINARVQLGHDTPEMALDERLWAWLTTTASSKPPTMAQFAVAIARYLRACAERGVHPAPFPAQRALAAQLHIHQSAVARAIALGAEPDAVIDALEQRVLTAEAAIELLSAVPDANRRAGIALHALRTHTAGDRPLGVRELAQLLPPADDPGDTVAHGTTLGATMPPARTMPTAPPPATAPVRAFPAPAAGMNGVTSMAFPSAPAVIGQAMSTYSPSSASPTVSSASPTIVEGRNPYHELAHHLRAIAQLKPQLDMKRLSPDLEDVVLWIADPEVSTREANRLLASAGLPAVVARDPHLIN